MQLVKLICTKLKRPAFEVMQWPASELEFWSLCIMQDAGEIASDNDVKNAKNKFKALMDM